MDNRKSEKEKKKIKKMQNRVQKVSKEVKEIAHEVADAKMKHVVVHKRSRPKPINNSYRNPGHSYLPKNASNNQIISGYK